MREGFEKIIRDRVAELLTIRGASQREFAAALGVSESWVGHFLKGRRNANDLPLLIRIARYFGVTVGYLLNESERGRDAGAATLLATWEELRMRDRKLLLQSALAMKAAQIDEPDSGPGPGSTGEGRTTKGPSRRR